MHIRLRPCRVIAVLSFVASGAASCGGGKPPAVASKDLEGPAAVTGATDVATDSIRVDVYLDATVSMSGFTAGGASNYAKFLEALESSLSNAWKKVDIHFGKFGSTSREIQRPEFLTARAPQFYTERGMNAVTAIDQVAKCDTGPRLNVVVTDLFQKEGDLNAIVGRIKDQCLQKGIAVGVLAMKSQFDGSVYDARGPAYPYKAAGSDTAAYRAFYALLFGQPGQFDALVQSLEQLSFVNARNLVVISPFVTRSFDVTVSKSRDSKDINMSKASGPNAFNFAIRKGGTGGTLISDVALTLNPASPPPRLERTELVAFRQGPTASTSPSRDLVQKKVSSQAGKYHVEAVLTINDPPGKYEYRIDLRTAPINGFSAPAFIRALSSDDPGPAKDPNKTLNLEKFIMDLRQAASSIRRPVLASWTLTVVKR